METGTGALGDLSMDKLIRLSKSCVGEREKDAVCNVLSNEFLGMGDDVLKFEESLRGYLGRKVVCVANGTVALQLALQGLGIGNGDEVLVQSLTYVASFQAIRATGALPIACDVDPTTLTLDCEDLKKRVTAKTRAIMPVHYSGGVGNLDAIYDFAKRHNLRVVEDSAHAFGSVYRNTRVGGFGDVACFSFDGIKNITSGEGGCIVADDEVVISRVQDARLLGVENDSQKRYAGYRSWDFDVKAQGWRYHMSNLMAAIGLEQLSQIEIFSMRRRKLAKLYDKLLEGQHKIHRIPHDYAEIVPHIYVIRIEGLRRREQLRKRLLEINIQTGVHYKPNHTLSYFKNTFQRDLPVTAAIYPELLTLPLHPDLTEVEVEYVCTQLVTLVSDFC